MAQVNELHKWHSSHGYRFTHDWFRFPGKFHPPLIEHVLASIKPRAVLDPMAGVGTVAVEAKAAGIPSVSLDVDPVSVFFATVKTTPILPSTLRAAWKNLSGSLQRFRRDEAEIERRMFRDIRLEAMRAELSARGNTNLERLTHWFRKYVLVDYSHIDHAIWNGGLPSRSKTVRRFFLACLLGSIRRISLADPTPVSGLEVTKHMKERIENGYAIDVFGEFSRRVELAIKRMEEYTLYLQRNGTMQTPAHVIQADCAQLPKLRIPSDSNANLILFSPPYCNAIEYWRRHRLEYFLGRFLDEAGAIGLHHQSIGRTTTGTKRRVLPSGHRALDRVLDKLQSEGRAHKARVLSQYFEDMRHRFNLFYDYLPRRGYCVIVVGDSTTHGTKIPTTAALTSIAEAEGFTHLVTRRYAIKNRVMQFPVKEAGQKIEHESIIVLRSP